MSTPQLTLSLTIRLTLEQLGSSDRSQLGAVYSAMGIVFTRLTNLSVVNLPTYHFG